MTNFTVHITSTGTPSRTASDPYTCYTAPYGAIGLASDLLSTYIYICLIGGRTPLYPKRTIRNRTMTFLLFFSSYGLGLVWNIAIAGQCRRPGAARQLVWVAIVKCILGPFWGLVTFSGAVQHLPPIQPKKCDGAAGNGEVGDTYTGAEEADLEAGGVETTRPGASRYQDASVQAGDGVTQWQELLEFERLPSYSTIDPHVISSEEREIGIEPWYAAPEITTSSRLLTFTDKNQECAHPASSHDQSTYAPAEVVAGKPKPSACSAQSSPEISYSHAARASPALDSLPEETPISAASQPLLPGSAEASGELGIIGKIVLILILGGLLAWMLAAHISLAVQSVASGNSGARTVGFTFLAVFLAVVPTFLIVSMSAWWKAAKTERDVWKAFNILEVQGPLAAATIISGFLLILYGDMNLGVLSGRMTGIVPSTTNTDELLSNMQQKRVPASADPNSGGVAEMVDNGIRGTIPTESSHSTAGSSRDPIMLSDDESGGAESETDCSDLDIDVRAKSDSDPPHVSDSELADGDGFSSGDVLISDRLVTDHQDDDNNHS